MTGRGPEGQSVTWASWQQLLGELEAPGPSVQWLHVPSHIGVRGNDKADLLADMGRWKQT